jgi:hypothetical protein
VAFFYSTITKLRNISTPDEPRLRKRFAGRPMKICISVTGLTPLFHDCPRKKLCTTSPQVLSLLESNLVGLCLLRYTSKEIRSFSQKSALAVSGKGGMPSLKRVNLQTSLNHLPEYSYRDLFHRISIVSNCFELNLLQVSKNCPRIFLMRGRYGHWHAVNLGCWIQSCWNQVSQILYLQAHRNGKC